MTNEAPLEAELGRDNMIILRLADLDSTWPSPPALPAGPGLYALYDKNHPAHELYIGRSIDVQRRVGQLIGAALTGARGLHSAGYKIGNGIAGGGVKVAAADLVVHVWAGQEAYDREAALINKHKPPYNTHHRGPSLNAEIAPSTGWLTAERCAECWARLGLDPTKLPLKQEDWTLGDWTGKRASCARRHYFIGWSAAQQASGLWVWEGNSHVFPATPGDSVAKPPEELLHVIDRWLDQRDEARQADEAAT